MSTSAGRNRHLTGRGNGQGAGPPSQIQALTAALDGRADDPGLRWYELGWLDPDGTRMEGRVGGRADVGTGWHSRDCADWVQAAPFRAHVRHLICNYGLAWRTLALLSGVPAPVMSSLLHGRNGRPQHRVHPVLARRLFDITRRDLVAAGIRQMPAELCRAALADLLLWGWTVPDLAMRTDLPAAQVAAIADGRRTHCTRMSGATILAAAQALRQRSAPLVPAGAPPNAGADRNRPVTAA